MRIASAASSLEFVLSRRSQPRLLLNDGVHTRSKDDPRLVVDIRWLSAAKVIYSQSEASVACLDALRMRRTMQSKRGDLTGLVDDSKVVFCGAQSKR